MGKITKVLAGLGVVAGISYFGKRRMRTEKTAAQGAGILGYLRGMGEGFIYGARTMLRFR
jgi:hypothetical protein